MGIKKFKPVTPSNRYRTVSDFAEITKSEPEKSLLAPQRKTGGRNNLGRITARHRGGGHKRRYRLIDFKRTKHDITARVASIEYDPNRSARIALLHYVDGEKRYIIAPKGLEVGATVVSGFTAPFNVGNAMPLERVPLGTLVHNIEMKPGRGGQLARGAGAFAQVMAKEGEHVTLRLGEWFGDNVTTGTAQQRHRHRRIGQQPQRGAPVPGEQFGHVEGNLCAQTRPVL